MLIKFSLTYCKVNVSKCVPTINFIILFQSKPLFQNRNKISNFFVQLFPDDGWDSEEHTSVLDNPQIAEALKNKILEVITNNPVGSHQTLSGYIYTLRLVLACWFHVLNF